MSRAHGQQELIIDLEALSSAASRRAFLAALMASATAVTSLTPMSRSAFAASGRLRFLGAQFPPEDASWVAFALKLEHLEEKLYISAVQKLGSQFGPPITNVIKSIRRNETDHIRAWNITLKKGGYKIPPPPSYRLDGIFRSRELFLKSADSIEDSGVHGYNGLMNQVRTPTLLRRAIPITSVEGKHVGVIRAIRGVPPTTASFDLPTSRNGAEAAIADFVHV